MVPAAVAQLLRHQAGVVARHQICALVPERDRRRGIYRDRHLEAVTSRVLRHRAVPPSPAQTLLTAVLDAGPGAHLWGKSGATWFGFGRDRLLPAHVAVARQRRYTDSIGQLHVVRNLCPTDLTRHLDVPVARPELIVLWLAGALTHRFGHDVALDRTEKVLDQAWRQRLIDGAYVHELAARSGGRGRSGIVVFRQALEKRPRDYQPAGSALEERFEEIVSPLVRKRLRRQVTVDVDPVIRTVDYRIDGFPLVAEINGETWHSSLSDRAADEERYQRLLALGLSVVVFWEHDIWHDATAVRLAMDRLTARADSTPTLHRPTPAPWDC
jgi:very-short-patch-repair endonuclease